MSNAPADRRLRRLASALHELANDPFMSFFARSRRARTFAPPLRPTLHSCQFHPRERRRQISSDCIRDGRRPRQWLTPPRFPAPSKGPKTGDGYLIRCPVQTHGRARATVTPPCRSRTATTGCSSVVMPAAMRAIFSTAAPRGLLDDRAPFRDAAPVRRCEPVEQIEPDPKSTRVLALGGANHRHKGATLSSRAWADDRAAAVAAICPGACHICHASCCRR